MFKLSSTFDPTGGQPRAIEQISKNLADDIRHQVLLGVTGSGKTFVISKVIEKIQRPALIISPNKMLAAQLYQEFKEFFPENAVHFFVSYYDYYQPEAYIPQTDTYIEKDAKINEEIDRLRHAATQDLLTRNDVVIIASVSCIYNIGSPEVYRKVSLDITAGQRISRKDFLKNLCGLQYQRNDIDFKPGAFRVRGEIIEIYLVTGKEILQIEFLGNKIECLKRREDVLDSKFYIIDSFKLFPAHFWVTPKEKLSIAIKNIESELQEQLKNLKKQKKLVEARRLEQITNYDLEMLKETGWCHGVENYSKQLEFRESGEPPFSLLDYYSYYAKSIANPAARFIVFVDESHLTVPQIRAMSIQDKARKQSLIEYGFRLPSALENRPLTFEEFNKKFDQIVYVSATPEEYERKITINQFKRSGGEKYITEQLIRPTGLLEPSIEIRPTEGQVENLTAEIRKRIEKNQRTLVLALTKRLAEALANYLSDKKISCQWLHSEIKTMERPKIIKDLRLGKYDVLVGINLLREGLDLPEVALVAVLDADKEGFLRSKTTLIQTMGRAARHLEGHVILYADKITKSMSEAITEIKRRRKIQEEYNKMNNIKPRPIIKEIRNWPFASKEKNITAEFMMIRDVKLLKKEMGIAAKNLDFERAAEIRDLIKKIK